MAEKEGGKSNHNEKKKFQIPPKQRVPKISPDKLRVLVKDHKFLSQFPLLF
jgi:hypothetical protein